MRRRGPRGGATQATVASAAGVSVATVSKVLNGHSDVAPETRARIKELLQQHNYVARGSGPADSTVRTFSMLFDAMENPNNLEIIRGATEYAVEAGVDVVVGIVPDDRDGAAWARRVKGFRREGLVLVTSRLTTDQIDSIQKAGVPLVTIDPVNIPASRFASVGATNFNGGVEATAHLLSLGHRRIAFVEGPGAVVSMARLHGYHAALAQAGIVGDSSLIRAGDFTFAAGVAAATELLSTDRPPTAVFAANDLMALGVLEAARAMGVRVPEDLSVVGFDDMPGARWSAPPLTTMRQPFAAMGRASIQNLRLLVDGEPLTSDRVELATTLVIRQSTARCRV